MIYLKKRKLRVDILTIFAVLILLIVGTIISYSYINNTRIIINIGNELVVQTNKTVISQFNEYLKPSELLNVSSTLLDDNLLDLEESKNAVNFMHVVLQAHPQLTSAYLTDMNKNMFMETRIPTTPNVHYTSTLILPSEIPAGTRYISEIARPYGPQMILSAFFKDQSGKVLGSKENLLISYDPKTRPWFEGAIKSARHRWIGIYKFYNTPGFGMTLAEPVIKNSKVAGVIAVDIDVDVISEFLQAYKPSKNSSTFIVDHDGNLIAYKSLVAQTSQHSLLNVSKVGDKRLEIAYQLFQTTHKNQFHFTFEHKKYLATFVPYAISHTSQWEIGTIVPIDDFIGPSKLAIYRNMLLSIFMLIVGLTLVYLFSHKISAPIMRLAKDTKDIKNLNFKKTHIDTHVYEILVLADAFNSAKKALSSFVKYVPKALVEKLIHTGTIAQVGGERKNISILFTDIRGFTSIAEEVTPESLMEHVSVYLDAVTHVIHDYHGNVDKYIGDSVMAFWGAPIDDGEHAKHACMAALSCRKKIQALNEEWFKVGKPVFPTRFGLNSGMAVVGNMGSSDRLNYTAIGDNVNLASRLEAINKVYGTEIIVSDSIYHACHTDFLFRPINVVMVKGKTQSIQIYELMAAKTGPADLIATPEQMDLHDLTFAAYEFYQAGEKDKALELYQEILQKYPDDPIASSMIGNK